MRFSILGIVKATGSYWTDIKIKTFNIKLTKRLFRNYLRKKVEHKFVKEKMNFGIYVVKYKWLLINTTNMMILLMYFWCNIKNLRSNPDFGKAKMYSLSCSLKLIVNFLSRKFFLLYIRSSQSQ